MLKMSSTNTYWPMWSWIVALSKTRGGCIWFERHYSCFGEVSPIHKILKGSSLAIVALTRKFSVCGHIWIWKFSLFYCAEHSLEVCPSILNTSCTYVASETWEYGYIFLVQDTKYLLIHRFDTYFRINFRTTLPELGYHHSSFQHLMLT